MLLNDYLNDGHRLFTNLYGICDDAVLIGRITATFGTRTMRTDYTPDQIAMAGQNVIDSNRPLLQQLFDYADKFNPMRLHQSTVTKTGTNSNDTTDGNTQTNDTTDVTTNTGTTSTTGNTSDTPNSTVSTVKSAYNATASRPYDTTTTTGTNTATSTATATDDLTATTKRTGTVTDARKINSSGDYSETVTEYGVTNADDISMAFEKYIQPYDYLAIQITRVVCELIW